MRRSLDTWQKFLLLCGVLIVVGLTSGCAQDQGGITRVKTTFDENGLPTVDYYSGKEAAQINAQYSKTPDGDVNISIDAGDVTAFEGQAIQAERIKAQTEAITGAIKDVLPSIVGQALCAAGVGTDC